MSTKYTARSALATVLSGATIDGKTSGSYSDLSTAIDNTTAITTRFLFAQVEVYLNTQASARSAGAYVAIYFVPEVDGTNYPDAGGATAECSDNYFVGSLAIDATTTARRLVIDRVRVPVGNFKVMIKNGTGQTFAATLNTVKIRTYSVEDVT
jgi:hypothetical protein